MAGFDPRYLILHDYGGNPSSFNPYHALVTGGEVRYRYPDNPYGQKAPHAFQLNPQAIGLAWGGPVGGKPSATDLEALRREMEAIKQRFPGIKVMSHGEAYQARNQGLPQASKLGRGLEEASWRTALLGGEMPATSTPQPVSMAGRALTAGHPASEAAGVAKWANPNILQASQATAPTQIASLDPIETQQTPTVTPDFNEAGGMDVLAGLGGFLNAAVNNIQTPSAPRASVDLPSMAGPRVSLDSVMAVLQDRAKRGGYGRV